LSSQRWRRRWSERGDRCEQASGSGSRVGKVAAVKLSSGHTRKGYTGDKPHKRSSGRQRQSRGDVNGGYVDGGKVERGNEERRDRGSEQLCGQRRYVNGGRERCSLEVEVERRAENGKRRAESAGGGRRIEGACA
jgi:hypothetical protein